MKTARVVLVLLCLVAPGLARSAEWTQFRGPGGLGVSDGTGLPVKWSSDENIAWKTDLPGPGTSSPIVVNGRVYAIQGSSLAIRAGGRGDVSETHRLWESRGRSTVPSPIYHDGRIYWIPGGTAHCVNAEDGEVVYQERLQPSTGKVYSSVIVADGKLYCVSQHNGTYVLAAKPEFELLAHNVFEDDDSRANASPIVDGSQLLLRTDRRLYCIGANQ